MTAKAAIIKRAPVLSLPPHDLADVMAVKALNDGTASPDQQVRALSWIIKQACMIGGVSYNPDIESATHFNEGRRFVGIALTNFVYEPVDEARKRLSKKS